MYEALINGTVTRDQFEDWVYEKCQDRVDDAQYWADDAQYWASISDSIGE